LGQVNDSKWLYEQNLVPKLVAKLDPTYEKEEDVQVNAARALVDVVVKCAPTSDSLLIRHLQHPSVLDKLFRYMFSGSRGSLTNSLSIVIVLVQREANRRNEIPPTGDLQGTESKDSITGLPEIIAHVLKHLPELSNLLKENQDLRKALPTQFGSLSPPLGETRMKAVELFLVLFRSNYPEVNKELAALNVISYIIDLFFKFEWNNMLHGLVESIIRTILDTDSLILKQSCFIQGKLVDRVLEAYAKNAEAVKARKGCRLGYMGHVVRLCGAIAYVLDRDVKLKQQLLLDQVKEWDAFVAGPLHQDNESHNAVLAGGAPTFPPEPEEQQAAYAPTTYSTEASRAPISSGQKDDDDDNDPFAFNDGDDTFNSSSTYGLPREEEEWNHENSATNQFQTEEHSDSSDEEPQPNFAPTDTGAGSSDDDDDDFHSRTGKTKKKTARHGVGSSPGGAESGVETVKEDGKSEASPVKATGSGSTTSTTSTTIPATTTTTTPAGKGTGDEWAAFED
jgi:serine/threonine-protein phosphatase 6 regulatory subunit 3